MARPYSTDLRERVVGAIEAGMSRRKAAAVFAVSASSAVKWKQKQHSTGSVAPRKMGGDRRSKLGSERDWLLARSQAEPDLTLEEIRTELEERGVRVGYGTVQRFFAGEGFTFKKNRARRRAGTA
jgi:putative transposase